MANFALLRMSLRLLWRMSTSSRNTLSSLFQPQIIAGQTRPYARHVALHSSSNDPPPPPGSVAPYTANESGSISTTPGTDRETQHLVLPAHGLYHFFKRVEIPGTADKNGNALYKYESLQMREVNPTPSGRSWKASELRLKSFQDLHTLWYITLRERNRIATELQTRKRHLIRGHTAESTEREDDLKCRQTMARIKHVLHERQLAFEGARKIANEELMEKKAKAQDNIVLRHKLALWNKHRKVAERLYRSRNAKKKEIRKRKAMERAKEGSRLNLDALKESEVQVPPDVGN